MVISTRKPPPRPTIIVTRTRRNSQDHKSNYCRYVRHVCISIR